MLVISHKDSIGWACSIVPVQAWSQLVMGQYYCYLNYYDVTISSRPDITFSKRKRMGSIGTTDVTKKVFMN